MQATTDDYLKLLLGFTNEFYTDKADRILSVDRSDDTLRWTFLDGQKLYEATYSGDQIRFKRILPSDTPAFTAADDTPYPDQEALDQAIDALDDADFQEQITGVVQPILDLVENAVDYQEVMGKLAGLYPSLNSRALEEKLSKAIFVSEAWGRVNAADS